MVAEGWRKDGGLKICSFDQSYLYINTRWCQLAEALDYVHTHGFITNSMYRQLTGVSDRTAHRDLEMLVERGRLKGTGQRSARRYVLA
jgi:Fic family protein